MPDGPLGASGATPIYLCTMEQYLGNADDDRAAELMELLASMLDKLAYQLVSGEAPRFNELWAAHVGTLQ